MSANPLSSDRGTERLRARRRRTRGRLGTLLLILLLVIIGSAFWLLWQPSTRIGSITVYGADQSIASYATDAMQGRYLGIVPRNSVFFYPAQNIRSAILTAYPDIAAVSIFREGLTGLSIKVIDRVPVARWCGATYVPEASSCYLFDASGYVYATSSEAFDASTTSTSEIPSDGTLNSFALFAPFIDASATPSGATIADADALPAAFDFARQVSALGSPVIAVAISADEADDYLASGTWLMYVLGQEQDAYSALISARTDYNLSDGSIQYLDLRFPGKIYLKKN